MLGAMKDGLENRGLWIILFEFGIENVKNTFPFNVLTALKFIMPSLITIRVNLEGSIANTNGLVVRGNVVLGCKGYAAPIVGGA